MSSVLKKASGRKNKGVVINDRWKWVEFTALNETDDPFVIRCKVRTSLIYAEIEQILEAETKDIAEVWEVCHPYVKEWNIQAVDEDGELCDVLPPSLGGAQSFAFAPRNLAQAIINALIYEPFSRVDPKSSTPVETTEEE